MAVILIIDDEEKLRHLLKRIISLEGFEVLEAANGKAGLKKVELQAPDVVLCDVKLPDGSGVDLVTEIRNRQPFTEVILLTAYGNIADGVRAIKKGAFDYITKGDDNEKIIPLLHRAIEKSQLTQRVLELQKKIGDHFSFDNVTGSSPAIEESIRLARKVAETDTTVLLTGETGTGKEVFAQAIHYAGKRQHQPFVAVNCSAFSRELLESELFGHKAGSFTGATKDTRGLFEEANGGTIFMDEIGEMAPELQAKLLRVLESGEFLKIGDSKMHKVDVRVIAATNRDLQKESETGHFRADLYYRLSVFHISLPPLRARTDDIALLAKQFMILFAAKTNQPLPTISGDFISALKQYHWPGNIRELKNVIERSVILQEGGQLTTTSLPVEIRELQQSGNGQQLFDLSSAEKRHIQKVLQHTKGNKTEAARLLNIGLTTLYRKIEEYKISV